MLAVEGVEPSATPVHHLLDDGSFAITVPANGLLERHGRRGGCVTACRRYSS